MLCQLGRVNILKFMLPVLLLPDLLCDVIGQMVMSDTNKLKEGIEILLSVN